jgi:4a-hydroxytetrahydrobiopterin dehydratase
MPDLADQHCVVCKPGTPTLSADDVERLHGEAREWSIVEADGHKQLTRTFKFKGFLPGVNLVDRIAEVAEAEGHHPDLLLRYGSLRVDLWTHVAGGLTANDFIMAAKIDRL